VQVATSNPTQQRLTVPPLLAGQLQSAVAAGRQDAAEWASAHPTGSIDRFRRDSIARIPSPPAAASELDVVRDAAATRTEAGSERAEALARRAGWETWEAVVAQIGESQGVEQGRRAQQLLEWSARRTDRITNDAKVSFDRRRPYEVDPAIGTVVEPPHGNAGYPSGHASGAWAAALALSAVAPERASEFEQLAAEVAYSRIYGGVHFPSDVIEGARVAAAVVADVLRREALGLPQH
jgi:acid phosphatase (class A)